MKVGEIIELLESGHLDFVRTARAKGAGETRVLTRHVLPNAGLRVLTMNGMEIGTAIGISLYIESAFEFEDLGRLSLQAIAGDVAIDLPLVLGVVTALTTIVVHRQPGRRPPVRRHRPTRRDDVPREDDERTSRADVTSRAAIVVACGPTVAGVGPGQASNRR